MFQRINYLLIALILFTIACGGNPEPAEVTPEPTDTVIPTEPATAEPDPTTVPPTEEPTAMPTATIGATPSPTGVAIDMGIGQEYDGIYFDAGGLGPVTINEVPQTEDIANAPYWDIYPAHQQFLFDEYPLDNTFHQPTLNVYPVQDFTELNPAARDFITELQLILKEQPTDFAEQVIPVLPLFNAAQVFRTHVDYLEFTNGRGIRFVTYYSQSVNPIANTELFYTFQGLTDDGHYYVSAIWPVSVPLLPDEPEAIEDYDAFAENYDNYLQELITGLEALSADEFIPTLTSLDNIVQSIDVMRPLMTTPANNNGEVQLTIAHPIDNSQLPIGETAEVSGYVQPGTAQTVNVTIHLNAHTLVSATVQSAADSGEWAASLDIPVSAVGPGRLTAQTETEMAEHQITLYTPNDIDLGPTTITLSRPYANGPAVEGMPLFFEGQVTNPISDTITIGILINDCTEFIARQDFEITGGNWTGQVILPAEVTGPACVTAYTGTYGEGDWREVAQSLEIFSSEDANAPRIDIPLPLDTIFTKGQAALIYGTAINPPNNQIRVELRTFDGAVIANTTTTTTIDTFGYWEVSLPLPADFSDNTLVVHASFVEDGQIYFAEVGIGVK